MFMYYLGAAITPALISAVIASLSYSYFAWKLVDKPRALRISLCIGIALFVLLFAPTLTS